MERIADLINAGFESSSGKTPEFKSFATKFKNDFKKELDSIGAKMTAYSVGHFYVSGFFRTKTDKCIYFSISDVRSFMDTKILVRTARDEKDYTGGVNQYVNMRDDDGVGYKIGRLFPA